MGLPVVDTLFEIFGPFLVPAVLFVVGAVGYGLLLLADRLLSPRDDLEWRPETPEADEEADRDCHEG